MQIMPATGQDIASRLSMTIEDSDLTNPEINIEFGTFIFAPCWICFQKIQIKPWLPIMEDPAMYHVGATVSLELLKRTFQQQLHF